MKKTSDKKRMFINSSMVTLSTILEKCIFLAVSIIIARYLSKEHYGEFTTALTYATLFALFSNIGITQTLVRTINMGKGKSRIHFSNALLMRTILAVTAYFIMFLSLYFTNYNDATIHLVLVFGLARTGNEYLKTYYALYDAKEKYLFSSLFTVLFSISFLAGLIVIIKMEGNYFHIAYVRLSIVAFFVLLIGLYLLKNNKPQFDVTMLKKFIRDSLPFGLQTILGNVLERINIIILSLMIGTLYSGIFNNAFMFFITIVFIPTVFHRVLIPYLYKESIEDSKNKFQFVFDIFSKSFSILSFFIFLIFFLFSQNLILMFFSYKYKESISILKIISFAIPFLFNICGIIMISLDEQKRYNRYIGIGTAFNIIMNIVLIHFYGAEGAAITTIITYFIIFILSHRFLNIKYKFNMKKTLTNYLFLVIISIICCFMQKYMLMDMHFLYSMIIVTILYIILIFAFLIRKNDIRIIKETFGKGKA